MTLNMTAKRRAQSKDGGARSCGTSVSRRRRSVACIVGAALAFGAVAQSSVPLAHAAPAPEVEYLYDVTVRRHYYFPAGADALSYGRGICDRVTRGESYAQVMSDIKGEVSPSDEFAANYLTSYAVNLLCPGQIWQLRNSAARYRPPAIAAS